MVVIRSYEDDLTESKKIRKDEILLELVAENDSEFFYNRTEMIITLKDLYESPEGKVFCPSTGTRRAEDNECLIVIDKRPVDPEELTEGYDGVYVTVMYGRYISDDTPASAPYPKETDLCTLKLERFITEDGKERIELTDMDCITNALRLIQEQER